MKVPAGTPTRSVTVQAATYEDAGRTIPKFSFPQPFDLSFLNVDAFEALGLDPHGIVRTLNQTVAVENIRNTLAARIRAAAAKKIFLDQEDLDRLIATYDCSGIVRSRSDTTSLSQFERALRTTARELVKSWAAAGLFSEDGNPQTIQRNKKNEAGESVPEPLGPGKLSIEDYEDLVEALASGEVWEGPEVTSAHHGMDVGQTIRYDFARWDGENPARAPKYIESKDDTGIPQPANLTALIEEMYKMAEQKVAAAREKAAKKAAQVAAVAAVSA